MIVLSCSLTSLGNTYALKESETRLKACQSVIGGLHCSVHYIGHLQARPGARSGTYGKAQGDPKSIGHCREQ